MNVMQHIIVSLSVNVSVYARTCCMTAMIVILYTI